MKTVLMLLVAALLASCSPEGSKKTEPVIQLGGNYIADMKYSYQHDDNEPYISEWPQEPVWVSQTGASISWLGISGWAEVDKAVFEMSYTSYFWADQFGLYYKEHITGEATATAATFRFESTWYKVADDSPTGDVFVETYEFSNVTAGTFASTN